MGRIYAPEWKSRTIGAPFQDFVIGGQVPQGVAQGWCWVAPLRLQINYNWPDEFRTTKEGCGCETSASIFWRGRVSFIVKLISWNVNGLRAVLRRNFLDYLAEEEPDILCLQEVKAGPNDIEQLWPAAYTTYWNCATKKGYSGTALFTKSRPLEMTCGMGRREHDGEGRVLTAEYQEFYVVNVYVPNSKRELTRLDYRQQWDRVFLRYLKKLEKKKPVIFCGDFNVAHTELDLANPKANMGQHGFTVEERRGFSAFVKAGFVDTLREFETGGGHYTWWSQRAGVRARNIGWRLDYFLVSAALRPRIKRAFIRCDIAGSDHCPVGIELE